MSHSEIARHQSRDHLVWIDLEMTGLNPETDVILQAALIITDRDLNELETYCIDIWQPEQHLENMVPFVKKMHEKTGLSERLRSSDIDLKKAEDELLARVSAWCPYRPILCGNTIHSDRKFIDRYMPALAGYLHYRMIDVTSVKILGDTWYSETLAFHKSREQQHDALFDIQQSIAELKHYRKHLFRAPLALPGD